VGGKVDRPELKKALEILGKGDQLIIWKLDRLSRSTVQLVNLISDLNEKGIGLKIITMGIDTTTPHGKLFFTIFAGLAELERDLISERTKAGLAAAKRRGHVGGRPHKLTSKQCGQIVDMWKAKSHTVKEICELYQVTPNTLYLRAINPHKKGLKNAK